MPFPRARGFAARVHRDKRRTRKPREGAAFVRTPKAHTGFEPVPPP
jgi:hypothetical protein